MSKTNSSLEFKTGFAALQAAVKAGRTGASIQKEFARLRQLHRKAAFATEREKVEAGRALGSLRLLWMISPRTCAAVAA